jgi:hypothetical protein
MIPERLIDLTTVFEKQNKIHTLYTHLGCVLLRIILGLLIYYKVKGFKSYTLVSILCILVITFFGNKVFITQNKTWKVYIRTVLFYSIGLIINSTDYHILKIYDKQSRNVAGLIIIFDALMGLQSRHIQNNFIS